MTAAGEHCEVKESRNVQSSLEEIKSGEEVVSREPSSNEVLESGQVPL